MNAFFYPAFWLIGRVNIATSLLVLFAVIAVELGSIGLVGNSVVAGRVPVTGYFAVLCPLLLELYLLAAIGVWFKKGLERTAARIEQVARGDLKIRIKTRSGAEQRQTEAGRAWAVLTKTAADLAEMVSRVRSSADIVADRTRVIAGGYADLSARTEEQAATLEETAANIEELSAAAHQNAATCRLADQSAEQARERAEEALRSMERVTTTIARIEDRSRTMREIVGLIEGIAFQTNVLALNAAVEAARAGDGGSGFAVVAAEVRALSQQSTQSAKEVKALIETSVEQIGEGTIFVTEAKQAVEGTVACVHEAARRIGAVAGASQEQSTGIDAIGRMLTQLESVAQHNASLATEGTATVATFDGEAKRMVESVSGFKISNVGG